MSPTKEKIISEAVKLFAIEGFEASSMRKIAAKVGISEPAVYRHFKNKNDLGRSIFVSNYKYLAHEISKPASFGDTAFDQLKHAITTFYGYYDQNPFLFRYLLTSQHKFLEDDMPEDDNVVEVMAAIIMRCMKERGLDHSKAAELTAIIFGAILQPSIFHMYGRLESPLSDLVDTSFNSCVGALEAIK